MLNCQVLPSPLCPYLPTRPCQDEKLLAIMAPVASQLCRLSNKKKKPTKTSKKMAKENIAGCLLYSLIKKSKIYTAPFNNMWTLTNIQSSTSIKCSPAPPSFRLVPSRARGNQIVVQSSHNEQSSAVVVSWEDPPNT